MSDETNNQPKQPEGEPTTVPVDVNGSELAINPTEQLAQLESPITFTEAPGAEEARRENFITRSLSQIRNGYENLSKNQKTALQLGVMALSTTIAPTIGIFDGGQHVQASEHFLQWEGLGGMWGLLAGAVYRVGKSGRQPFTRPPSKL